MRLLIVEDDLDVAETTGAYLRRNGYVVDLADSLDMAREALATNAFDLVILDRMLPDGEGADLIAESRRRGATQRFLLLTALAGVDDRIAGLELGAVDYIGKPFEPRELLARIRNALRRIMPTEHEVRRFGRLTHDADTGAFYVDDEPLVLRRTEALVLAELMARPGALVQRQTLEARVYGYDNLVNANSLESQISRLRHNLIHRTGTVRIVAVRGVGYRLAIA
ncbi:response regulator transcription factor [Sphingomonas sp. 2R-10]|uniref:response regulator transcription factor n=1 Tax=Sphingomonas sp. 2R-10 TaxID=3045148 RepID=UPI000F771FDB|nr:response regulator transcription factor [Sphingomonas sp. 2R-10]MDJ0276416.1 response regulator transcription factor [Sphingomonas sp. 2R-10]